MKLATDAQPRPGPLTALPWRPAHLLLASDVWWVLVQVDRVAGQPPARPHRGLGRCHGRVGLAHAGQVRPPWLKWSGPFMLNNVSNFPALEQPANDWPVMAGELIQARQTVLPKRLLGPGPNAAQQYTILAAAAAAPDHGQLLPWRFVAVPDTQRERLADVFGLHSGEHAVCFVSVGTVRSRKPARMRPAVADYLSALGDA